MTHVENLPRIIAEGGLVCDAEAERRKLCKQSIAHAELKQRRASRAVEKLFFGTIAAGGGAGRLCAILFYTPVTNAVRNQGRICRTFQGKTK